MKKWQVLGWIGVFAFAMGATPNTAAEQQIKIEVEGRGTIVIAVYPDKAPKAVERILGLVKSGFYNQQRFHKVVRSPKPFLVQIGDPNSKSKPMDDPNMGTYRSGTLVPYENSGLKHVRGAVGLARLEDNRNGGDSQFYIMLGTFGFLDGQYTVFGNVIQGADVLDKIELGDRVTSVTLSK